MDADQPAHRLEFATRLRDLRRECGQPPYRALSTLAHASYNSLSAAAAGRRLPTWETTRGYVTACLRHAGREADIDRLLPQWRRAWEEADVRERALRIGPEPATPAPAVPAPAASPRRRSLFRLAGALLAVLMLVATMAAAGTAGRAPQPMAGLYNILVAPFDSMPALHRTLLRDLRDWAATDTAIEVRESTGVPSITVGGRQARLNRLAAEHHADVVLSGRLRTEGGLSTMAIEVLLTDRVFGETPEFVGHHELRLTEPADLIRGNIELSRRIADDTMRYIKAVVAFVRGLGHYALDDYQEAERQFRTSDRELTTITAVPRHLSVGAEVILMMLGNTIGREKRYAEAAATFRRALARRPGYARATVGLAEALRAQAGCRRDDGHRPVLDEALTRYRAALNVRGDPLLEMKARLGLGLTHQCLGIAGVSGHWQPADAEFAGVLRVHATGRMVEEAGRQSLRLAAEARAGQALTAYLTAGGAPATRSRALAAAAAAYEDALAMLSRIGVSRPTIRGRELIFLGNLRDVYVAAGASAEARAVEARIRQAGGTP